MRISKLTMPGTASKPLDKMPNLTPVVWYKYLALGVGVAGFGYCVSQRIDWSEENVLGSRLKLSLVGVLTSALGYLGVRYLQVTHSPPSPNEENVLDKAIRETHDKLEEAKEDIRDALEQKAEETWLFVKEKYLSGPVKEAFGFFDNIFNNLRDFCELDTVPLEAPLVILLALVRVAQRKTDREWLESLPEKSDPDYCNDRFRLHHRMAEFACNVYGASGYNNIQRAEIAKELEILPENIELVSFEDEGEEDNHCPKFIIFTDLETKLIVMTIRGTHSMTDVIIDLVCDDQAFLDGFAHRGIVRSTEILLRKATPTLAKLAQTHADYGIMLTGHSLGAATAETVTMAILSDRSQFGIPEGTKVTCVAVAPPPVYRSERPYPPIFKSAIDIYINHQDCIPRTSLGSIARLFAMVKAINELKFTPRQQLKLITGYDADHPEVQADMSTLQSAVASVQQTRFPFLEHPGTIHYLFPYSALDKALTDEEVEHLDTVADDSDKFFIVKQESSKFSHQLFLMERMVLDHLRTFYKKAFEKVCV